MIFFNILCILGIITTFVIMWAIFAIKKQTTQALESVQNTSDTIGQVASDLSEGVLGGIFKPRKSWVDVALQFLKK
jgi:hypothetical protein